MKNKITPTHHELMMRDNEFIVTKTDLKGRIIYANRIFVEFSGYTQEELYMKQQNIVRHPDMPRGVFRLLWQTIQQGAEFNGYVKNMSKDGSYYWVFANVTPSFDNRNNIIGYYSVRRKASETALSVIEPIYQKMLQAEKQAGAKDAVEASLNVLNDHLQEHGVDYEQFSVQI